MSISNLPVDYTDDVLNTSLNTKRKYNMIQNDDGTVSFEDVTDYNQTGSDFGAVDINNTNQTVNDLIDDIYNTKILWSGAVFLNSGQTISLSEPISEQKSGIIIVFSRYEDGGNGAQNYGWQTTYIPKYVVNQYPYTGNAGSAGDAGGWCSLLVTANGGTIGNKYYYISDQSIIGVDSNGGNNNRYWVFRYVIGI